MSITDITLSDFNVLCTKAEGRDKLARLFQYAARALVGAANLAAPKAGSFLSKVEQHSRTTMVQLAGARRTHRWCKEIPVIQSIPKCLEIADPVDRALELLQKVTLATFMVIDHIGLLKQWKILPGGKRSGTGTIQLGLQWFCYSNIFGVIIQGKKLHSLRDKEEKAAERRKCAENCLKHALLVLQTAHLSRVYETHDIAVGLAGIVTSLMDIKPQLPEKKAAAPLCPDAKGKAK